MKIFSKGKGIKGVASNMLVLATCVAFVVPALLVIEAVRRLNEKEAAETVADSEEGTVGESEQE